MVQVYSAGHLRRGGRPKIDRRASQLPWPPGYGKRAHPRIPHAAGSSQSPGWSMPYCLLTSVDHIASRATLDSEHMFW